MLILIAGPYRSGTGDDPAKMAENLKRLEAPSYALFRAGHVPMIGEWVALPVAPDLPDFATRQTVATAEKDAIARRAAELVRPGAVVFLDGGTTTAALARALPRHFAFTIVTHSPTIACELERHPTADVVLIGGRLYKHSMVAVGAMALEAIRDIRADLYFMGVTAAHPVEGLTTGDMEEARTKRAIAAAAAETWVMLTREKLGTVSPWKVMPMEDATGMLSRRATTSRILPGMSRPMRRKKSRFR